MKKLLVLTALLFGIASVTFAATSMSLRVGATGDTVRMVQQNLVASGISVSVTGTYDQKTAEAVKKFQKAQGLTADGIAGKTTQDRLAKVTTSSKTTTGTATNFEVGGGPKDPWAILCANGLPHLQVLAPNGGETYNAGDAINITWRTCNMSASEQVSIGFDTTFAMTMGITNLRQANTGSATLVAQPSWFLPGGFQGGKFYKVFVYGDEATDNSNATFTIKAPIVVDVCPNIAGVQTTVPTGYTLSGGQCIKNPVVSPSVKVVSPNGGEIYTRGLTTQTGDYLNYRVEVSNAVGNGSTLLRMKNISGVYLPFSDGATWAPSSANPIVHSGGWQMNSNIPAGKYYIVANWTDDFGQVFEDQSDNYFTVKDPATTNGAPTILTNAYSNLVMDSGKVRLNGSFTSNGAATSTYFEYKVIGGSLLRTSSVAQTSQTGVFSSDLANLSTANYQYRACGTNSYGTNCGDWISFVIDRGAVTYQCNDGIDNDNDGFIDYPADPGCATPTDNDESNGVTNSATPILLTPIDNNIFAISNPYSKTAVTFGHLFKLKNTSNEGVWVNCDGIYNHITSNFPFGVTALSTTKCMSSLVNNLEGNVLISPNQEIIVSKADTLQATSANSYITVSGTIDSLMYKTSTGGDQFEIPRNHPQFQSGWSLSTPSTSVNF